MLRDPFPEFQQIITLETPMEAPAASKSINDIINPNSSLIRLRSLQKWKGNPSTLVTRSLLARFGFSYDDEAEQVKCLACHLHVNPDMVDFHPRDEHLNRSPLCPFVVQNPQLFQRAETQQNLQAVTTTMMNLPEMLPVEGSIETDGISSIDEVKFLSNKSSTSRYQLRLNTFSNWQLITPSGPEMAAAGFFYTNITDRVICLHCHVMLHKWTEADRPYEIHSLVSPMCPFVTSYKTEQMLSSSKKTKLSTDPPTQVLSSPVHEKFATIPHRLETFKTWPHTEVNPLPAPMALANAGFFYTGEKAFVRCFYCNGALRNWQANDDPKVEHARWFPHCAYIRQFIGEDLYDAIQRKNRQILAEKNGFGSAKNAWSNEERDRMVKARLDLPIFTHLRKNGYDFAVLRKIMDMQLQFKKDDFQTTDDLCIAYFVLQQQVKVINGNEKNILIPADCLKAQKETPTPSMSPLNIQDSSSPRSLSPNPSPKRKHDGETRDCIVCCETECQVACMPCGHFTTCVPCGHSLKTCPMCRAPVKSLVRVFL